MSDTQIREVHQSEGGRQGGHAPARRVGQPRSRVFWSSLSVGPRAAVPCGCGGWERRAQMRAIAPGSQADKSSYAHRQAGGEGQTQLGEGMLGAWTTQGGEHPATSSCPLPGTLHSHHPLPGLLL